MPAKCLTTDDFFIDDSGNKYQIKRIDFELLDEPVSIYNMEVEDNHTYFIMDLKLLVHNKCSELQSVMEKYGKNFSDVAAEYGDEFAKVYKEYYKNTSKFRWDVPESHNTYGHAFTEHGSKRTDTQLKDRARTKNVQQGKWLDNKAASDFVKSKYEQLPKDANGLPKKDVYTYPLPSGLEGRVFLVDGTETTADAVKIVIRKGGTITTAYPFNSKYPN